MAKIIVWIIVAVLFLVSLFLTRFEYEKAIHDRPELNVPKRKILVLILSWIITTALLPLSVYDYVKSISNPRKDVKK